MRSAVGRVLGLVLVGVALMSTVGLAASQTFINKTGKSVTGITIEFSKRVMITRHDSAFSDQSPSGRSDQFTFSGRDLRNRGRFTISWMPSSGKVVDYEWIEKAQPAPKTPTTTTQQEEEFKLPDPNTPPILYGNDYPGPDEALYQPQPDEQIWLTDLDGHEDIYDNDSIKINYAPGFDVSQITKIEVYRNGIKLRFLPEKFDVLTNAQMKTFDGNPAEHSPASNHTDHAIMGYEYKMEIHTADHVWMMTKTVKSGFRWRPKEVWAYMNSNWVDSLTDYAGYDDIVRYFTILKEDGFTGVSLEMSYYMDSPHDNNVKTLDHPDASIISFGAATPSNENLQELLGAAGEAGLETHVMSHIYISERYWVDHGWTYQAMIDPNDPRAFFDSFSRQLERIIPILNKYHVRLLTVLDETDILDQTSPNLIKNMLTRLSVRFNGELGINETTNQYLLGRGEMRDEAHSQKSFFTEAGQFWDWRDERGTPMRLEYSCWATPMDTRFDQRLSVMMPNFVKFWEPAVNYYRSRYPDVPQMFGELGQYNSDGVSILQNYWDNGFTRLDEQERSDSWLSHFNGARTLGIDLLNIWGFSICDWSVLDYHDVLNVGMRYPDTPCIRVITSIIKPPK